jgi:predicted protein tyrosine phosphatase
LETGEGETKAMIEVYPGLFIGSRLDYETLVSGREGWGVVHACRSYHQMTVGYRLWGVPRRHPDYLAAQRDNRLALRLIDFPFTVPLRKEMIRRALDFMDMMRAQERKVLVHCVYGRSRSPSIGLLYMAARLHVLPVDSLEAAEERFREIYAPYQPNRAIRGHLRRYWREYCAEGGCL